MLRATDASLKTCGVEKVTKKKKGNAKECAEDQESDNNFGNIIRHNSSYVRHTR
jgi:hypothetical protein